MEKLKRENTSLVINGGKKVHGEIQIPGDKISAVHILFASLLSNEETMIKNMHFCDDVLTIIDWIIENDIASVKLFSKSLLIKPKNKGFSMTSISKSRASICLVSASALKFGRTEIDSDIGGCCFANRLIDRHLELIKTFGISICNSEDKYVAVKTKIIDTIDFDCSTKFGPSIGATAHALIAALIFKGSITLTNVALEPVIDVLIKYLRETTGKMVVLTDRTIKIYPVKKISHFKSTVLLSHDTTIALTYISLVMATEGNIYLKGVKNLIPSIKNLLNEMNVQSNPIEEGLHVSSSRIIHPKLIECLPWPGIPSDAGPIIISGLCLHKGETRLIDKIYDSRATHVEGLNIMGYCVSANGQSIMVNGQIPHKSTVIVTAIDIRAGAALLIGASAREAKTVIRDAHQISRGYQNIIENLKSLNVDIKLGEPQWKQEEYERNIANGNMAVYP